MYRIRLVGTDRTAEPYAVEDGNIDGKAYYGKFRKAGDSHALIGFDLIYSSHTKKLLYKLNFFDIEDITEYELSNTLHDLQVRPTVWGDNLFMTIQHERTKR